jgi:hypothetical protein
VLANLQLWMSFLLLAFEGISLNLIFFCISTHMFWPNAGAEHGMHELCVLSGKAWSFELLLDCRVGFLQRNISKVV